MVVEVCPLVFGTHFQNQKDPCLDGLPPVSRSSGLCQGQIEEPADTVELGCLDDR